MEKGAKLELSDTVKAYHHISVNFSLPEGIDEEFLEVHFEPTKILIANQTIPTYPEDRPVKFNESGSFNFEGQYIQRIPIALLKTEEIKGSIKVEGILKVALAANMVKLELEQNKKLTTVQNKSYELLGIQGSNGYIKGNWPKEKSFKDKDYKFCADGEGLKRCGTMFTIPFRCYEYLAKGIANFDSLAYQKILDTYSYASFTKEDKVILIKSGGVFNKIVLFSPDNMLTAAENINGATINYGEEIGVTLQTITKRSNEVRLTFDVIGLDDSPYNYIKIKELNDPIDNTGQVMRYTSAISNKYTRQPWLYMGLQSPAKHAKSISPFQGVLTYYHPTIENKGRIQIEDALSKSNINLLSSIDGVQLYLLEEEGYPVLLRQKEAALNRLSQELEQIEEAYKNGDKSEELYTKSTQVYKEYTVAKSLVEALKFVFIEDAEEDKYNFLSNEENVLKFYCYDPEEKIMDIFVRDENKKVVSGSSFGNSYVLTLSVSSKPTSEWLIDIILENEEGRSDLPFLVKKIRLPEE